jgi:hypothetical protein
MLVLGVTASILALFKSPPDSPLGGIMVCYFVATASMTARHLWRICFAFFIATGSFFLGQQDVLPQAVRGSPILFVLAFAPFALMLFWLARVRFSRMISQSQAS